MEVHAVIKEKHLFFVKHNTSFQRSVATVRMMIAALLRRPAIIWMGIVTPMKTATLVFSVEQTIAKDRDSMTLMIVVILVKEQQALHSKA